MFLAGMFLLTVTNCKKNSDENSTPTSITDIDGNVYHTITIGTQVWLVENLKVLRYRNGDPIPNVTDATERSNLSIGACWWHDNDMANKATYGALYNWYAVSDSRNLAPIGWHVPTDAEWTTLTTFLGGESVAGGKMKEVGFTHWFSPNTGATNSSGFTALAAGLIINGRFSNLNISATFWASSQYDDSYGWSRDLNYTRESVDHSTGGKSDGFSVIMPFR